ncbi:large ribosomal subunit protein eL28-like [Lineus longissimus]|uniref:large ribosomal subunit protein eL28-like n=1 Tax=Lineus longissimus TaxID=88925 RepID=UPI00315C5804
MSADLQWQIIRKNSCFLVKGNGVTFTKEPNNLTGRNSFRYNGLVHKKTVGVEACSDGKGVVVVTRKSTGARKPSKSFSRVELKRGSRRSLDTIRKTLRTNRYRKDLKMPALRRASAILYSQRPIVLKKKAPRKKRE